MSFLDYIRICWVAWWSMTKTKSGMAIFRAEKSYGESRSLTIAVATDQDADELKALIEENWESNDKQEVIEG